MFMCYNYSKLFFLLEFIGEVTFIWSSVPIWYYKYMYFMYLRVSLSIM